MLSFCNFLPDLVGEMQLFIRFFSMLFSLVSSSTSSIFIIFTFSWLTLILFLSIFTLQSGHFSTSLRHISQSKCCSVQIMIGFLFSKSKEFQQQQQSIVLSSSKTILSILFLSITLFSTILFSFFVSENNSSASFWLFYFCRVNAWITSKTICLFYFQGNGSLFLFDIDFWVISGLTYSSSSGRLFSNNIPCRTSYLTSGCYFFFSFDYSFSAGTFCWSEHG